MHLTRRTPHPKYGTDFELQTFTCRVCRQEVERKADRRGEVMTLWPPKTISSDEDCERLDPALEKIIKENQWVEDFVKRLNYTIEDIVRKK
jgi:hypothetical protein